ncbi:MULTISPECIES: hypothetical protein [unclassified Streptomyces]|uniref:hypothetical protein n=1 Tax=unclassified Streptomyces TaxID=2593676 RepID=UPI002E1912A5|nr:MULTISPECIES: hypothetical protein [unclassified Streptomyces]
MNTYDLIPGPEKPVRLVRDEYWELVTRLPEFTAIRAVFPGLLARGKSLPMRLGRVQLGRVHGPSSTHLSERGELS